jgi:hypothetical protein
MAWQIKQSKKDCLWQYSYIVLARGLTVLLEARG